jgi:hypothetical protein
LENKYTKPKGYFYVIKPVEVKVKEAFEDLVKKPKKKLKRRKKKKSKYHKR